MEDLRDLDGTFDHYRTGAMRRKPLQYRVADDVAKLVRIRKTFFAERFGRAPAIAPPGRYGFVIGLPRSGTTMAERVLTGRLDVGSNGETDQLLPAVMDGRDASRPDTFEKVAADPPAGRTRLHPTCGPCRGSRLGAREPATELFVFRGDPTDAAACAHHCRSQIAARQLLYDVSNAVRRLLAIEFTKIDGMAFFDEDHELLSQRVRKVAAGGPHGRKTRRRAHGTSSPTFGSRASKAIQ